MRAMGAYGKNLLAQIDERRQTSCRVVPLRGVLKKRNNTTSGVVSFFGSPMRNRTADSAVRGQRLNRLTMRPFFIVIEISLFMITYFFVFCKCLHARCRKILKFCLSGKDLNIFFKKNVHRNLAYFIFRDILAPKSLLRG